MVKVRSIQLKLVMDWLLVKSIELKLWLRMSLATLIFRMS